MLTARKVAAAAAVSTALLLAGVPAVVSTASAATVVSYTEKTTSVNFVPAIGEPDPRGAGSVLFSTGDLYEGSDVVGSVNVTCETTRVVDGDYYGYCEQTLEVPGGALYARGEINETALERFEPQTIEIFAGAGIYADQSGTLEIQQIVFPDEFVLTATLN